MATLEDQGANDSMSSSKRFFIPRDDRKFGNRYELLEPLGDGSHGTVWRAMRTEDSKIVAVKIPRAQGESTEYLEEGTPLIGQPSHPNVVSIYWMDWVPPTREYFAIEMEYFPSSTLAELLESKNGGFVKSYAKLLALYEQVLAGVEYLHGLGMCHGDIKPHNILISGDSAKITDFGSSVWPEDMYARTRENGGTILYSAPELASTLRRGRSMQELFLGDIYSLGVLLYHVVTGDLPHDTLNQVVSHAPFRRPRELNSSVSPAVEEVILRCMSQNPAQRYQTIALLMEATSRARRAQIDYVPERLISRPRDRKLDWSTDAVEYLQQSDYARAEAIAKQEFESTRNPHALLIMINASIRGKRFFEALDTLDNNRTIVESDSKVQTDFQYALLKVLLETRSIARAEKLLTGLISQYGETPDLLYKQASILGAQAKYEEACEILLRLNRDFPNRPEILKRIVTVYEQLRDVQRASAFLKAYERHVPSDPWASTTRERFSMIGIR
jgi:serine/threonine-protein kinase